MGTHTVLELLKCVAALAKSVLCELFGGCSVVCLYVQSSFHLLTPVLHLQLLWLLGPRGIPADWRHMEGFGVHTFEMVNKAGKRTYVKFTWKPTCGVKTLNDDEAKQVGEANNVQSHATEDLWNTIESGMIPLL